MNFAIVLFIDEGDAPGIIATNWLDRPKNLCWYPNVKSHGKKKKLLLAKAMPQKDWLQCSVRVLKEFDNYEAARAQLAKSEDTSNLDSDNDTTTRRKRKFKQIRLPGEESSTEEGEWDSQSIIIPAPIEPYPDPPAPSQKIKKILKECNCSGQGDRSEEVHQMKKIKNTMWGFMEEVTASIKEMQNTMSVMLSELNEIKSKRGDHMNSDLLAEIKDKIRRVTAEEDEDFHILSSMPVGINDFANLNEKMASNYSFRQKVKKSFMMCGGKDCKSFTSNILRKLLTDDVVKSFHLLEDRKLEK